MTHPAKRDTMTPIRIQWIPNLVRSEKRICLTRIRWETGGRSNVGFGKAYSQKLSVSIQWKLADLWIGAFWRKQDGFFTLWLCLVPCVPIRFHYVRSYGGIIP